MFPELHCSLLQLLMERIMRILHTQAWDVERLQYWVLPNAVPSAVEKVIFALISSDISLGSTKPMYTVAEPSNSVTMMVTLSIPIRPPVQINDTKHYTCNSSTHVPTHTYIQRVCIID